jgi:Concanavalin A-like lectin/glucanases superfamily/TIR domain
LAIAVTCTHCGVKLRFKAQHVGKTAKCRACSEPVIVQGETIPDHDVFLSYSSKDKNVADAVCAALEAKRIRCWMAPRDILPGKAWAGAILDAIDDVHAMVLVYSANSNASPQVLREIDRAISRDVVVIPFRIENCAMSKEMEYYIAAAHWLDAMDGPMEEHIATLVATTRRLLASEPATIPRARNTPAEEKTHSWNTLLPVASICLSMVAIAAIGLMAWRMNRPPPEHASVIASVATASPVIPASQPAVAQALPSEPPKPVAPPPVPVQPAAVASSFITGRFHNAVALNGADNYIDCGNPQGGHFDLSDKATIEAWVRFDALPADFAVIASKDEGPRDHNKWMFGYATNYFGKTHNLIFWFHAAGGPQKALWSSTWIPEFGEWHHLAVVKDGDEYAIYTDGYRNGHISLHTIPATVNGPLQFGIAENRFQLHGALDEVRLWNIARTQEELRAQMETELTGKEPGLVGYWPLNEAGGTTLNDLSGNGNNGVLNGGH